MASDTAQLADTAPGISAVVAAADIDAGIVAPALAGTAAGIVAAALAGIAAVAALAAGRRLQTLRNRDKRPLRHLIVPRNSYKSLVFPFLQDNKNLPRLFSDIRYVPFCPHFFRHKVRPLFV